MKFVLLVLMGLGWWVHGWALERDLADVESAAHGYWVKELRDPFTAKLGALESGEIALDRTSEKAFVASLLEALEVPVESQMLVYSTTSLQLRRISPRNPRAIYFNEDVSVGWVPGGQVEVVSVDPELGAIFYIFDVPRGMEKVRVERSDRCMNCHARELTGRVPGLMVRSVMPGPNGGSLDAFRTEEIGHGVAMSERFGGWHVTGEAAKWKHYGNRVGDYENGKMVMNELRPGERFDWSVYPVGTSDVVPQLLHEHQAGFVNRAVEANYAVRAFLHEGGGSLSAERERGLEGYVDGLVRYILFADEAALPGRVEVDAGFLEAFGKNARVASGGRSLKEFDLETRMMRWRCSYMIYSVAFEGLHAEVKGRVVRKLGAALKPDGPREFSYLPLEEKAVIRGILRETLELGEVETADGR